MKYNKSEIMKNAWSEYKGRANYPTYDSRRNKTFGDCLRSAWFSAKEAARKEKEISAFAGKQFKNDMDITIGYTTYSLRRWTNYGKDRVYVSGAKTRNAYVDLMSNYDNVGCSKLVSIIRSLAY